MAQSSGFLRYCDEVLKIKYHMQSDPPPPPPEPPPPPPDEETRKRDQPPAKPQ